MIRELGNVKLRPTQITDLDFVISAEREEENAKYVGQWTKEQHINSFSNKDILHLIVEEAKHNTLVGYLIIAGIENKNNNIEFRRIVISKKNKGYGKSTLREVKNLAFNKLNAHRLWLDVRFKNKIAQHVYKAEGFKEEGILRECILYNNEYESLIVMSILKNEYIMNDSDSSDII